tara:strand:- start:232 stop:867 length:636 start_codon:yes stop_codon:yes gene_type:complete
MVLPLLALAPYAGAGLAALGGAGRFFNSPMGQRTVQGGLNLVNRGIAGLQQQMPNFVNPLQFGSRTFQQAPLTSTLGATTTLSTPQMMVDAANMMGVGSAEAAEPSAADVEEMLEKDKKEEKESKKTKVKGKPVSVTKNDDGSITKIYADGSFEKFRDGELVAKGGVATASKKKKTKKEMMKKGGYVKKKRKRKPYKPSSFVKMKGRKRYI